MPRVITDKERAANTARMRRKRAAGAYQPDPLKEMARKAEWYYRGGEKLKREIGVRKHIRLQEAKESGIKEFSKKIL